ncbi:type III pantothenate kinase [Lutibacter oricola]|uniref:Type III pantothenate kinase n=1 Tax=Lutibacter oricola TaxID=762486 RepID=A0A1H2UCQ8_9FLAO|nr:type III pantothenate kinase [Lutibacter oricola]SDW53787.1 type III pantothenate kinase [Lutibacter oricola]
MNLIIDVGNTRIKCAVFNASELIHIEIFTGELVVFEIEKIAKKYSCNRAIISSVKKIKKNILEEINSKIDLIALNSSTKIPFNNKYGTPKTLGVDRIALVASAVSKYPNKNVLVIDAGTCITYDFVDREANYYGGAISPGIKMRYKSLKHYTNKLPELEIGFVDSLMGNSTNESIHIGVTGGVINEIDSFINKYKEKNRNLTIVLTGGDVNFLAKNVKNSIFANPNFLLEGLNSILTYNI